MLPYAQGRFPWVVKSRDGSLWFAKSYLDPNCVYWTRVLYNLPHGPLTRYAKLWVAHDPGMSGTLSPQQRVSDPDIHHGTSVMHVPWCMPESLTCGFRWSGWSQKRSWYFRRMRYSKFCVSGKRSIARHSHNLPYCAVKQMATNWLS